LARHVHIRKELHLYLDDTVAPTSLAPPALDVEREAARVVPAHPGLGHLGEYLANRAECARIRCRVGARGASDGRLVYLDYLVYLLDALDTPVRTRALSRPVQHLRHLA